MLLGAIDLYGVPERRAGGKNGNIISFPQWPDIAESVRPFREMPSLSAADRPHRSVQVPGRTAKQCRERWHYHLDPSVIKGAWSDDDNRRLRDAYNTYSGRWAEIAANVFPGRTDDACAPRPASLPRLRAPLPTSAAHGAGSRTSGTRSPATAPRTATKGSALMGARRGCKDRPWRWSARSWPRRTAAPGWSWTAATASTRCRSTTSTAAAR